MNLLQQFVDTLTSEKAAHVKYHKFLTESLDPKYQTVGYVIGNKINKLTHIIAELEQIDAAMNVERMGLLQKFWGRTSDACPLECTEHEAQLAAWEKWVLDEWAPVDPEDPPNSDICC